jgi:hypothetical protein
MSPRGTHFENLLFSPATPGVGSPALAGPIMAMNHRQSKKMAGAPIRWGDAPADRFR